MPCSHPASTVVDWQGITMWKLRKTAAAAAVALALTATATACGKEGSPEEDKGAAGNGDSSSQAPQLPEYEVAQDVSVEGSKTFERMTKRGTITIGVKADQPGLGFQDPGSKEYSGFDIEIAKMMAASLGFAEKDIEWKTIASANRETALSGGQVDIYVGTYTINDERKKQVSFAGPYFHAGQDLLVKKDSGIASTDDLDGKKVCSATGSTSIQNIKDGGYGAETVEYDTYSICVDNLINGQVDAVTTDDAILKGYAAQNPEQLEVLGKQFSDEPYGVGLAKNDKALRDALNDALEEHHENGNWQQAYDATLGLSGSDAEMPELERY